MARTVRFAVHKSVVLLRRNNTFNLLEEEVHTLQLLGTGLSLHPALVMAKIDAIDRVDSQ